MTSTLLRICSKTVALTTLLSTLATTLMAQDAQWLSFGHSTQAEGSPPQVDISRSTPWNLDMNVTFPGMMSATTPEGDQIYQQFVMPNSGHIAEIGQPQLPMVSYYVAVPAGARVSVDVAPPDFQEFGGYLAYPAQEPFPDVEEIQCPEPPPVDSKDCPLSTSMLPDPDFILDTETYNSRDFYPSAIYEFEGPVYIRGARIMILRLFPVQINPASQALRVYPQISVKFTFENSRGYFIEKKFRSSAFDELFNNLLVNPEPVLAPPQDEIGSIAAATSDTFSDNNTLLIVTHDNFLDAANQLAAWKIQKGITTTVKTTAEIGTDASTIQAYIQNAYDTWSAPPTAVLLIGDAEFIPPHYKTYHSYHGFDIGTDLYYATVDGSDYFPDINIGRLSVDTLAEATKRVEDIINYERNPVTDNNFYQKAAIAAYFQDNNRNNMADRRFAQTSEDIALFLSDSAYLGQYQVDRIYYTPNAVTPENWGYWFSGGPAGNMGQSIPNHLKKPDFAWRGNLYDISDAINEGRFLVTHRDHGTRWGWDAPYYHDTQASELTNGNKLPVVWSVNCETGWFDNETDHPSWTSSDAVHFSEVWERNPNGGAIGVIAATRVSYSGYNDRLFWGWADAIWPDFEPNYNGSTSKTLANHMGTVLNYGKYYLAEKYGEGTTRKLEFEIFHWFGDPTLPMWTQVPQTLSVNYDEGLTAGSTAVAVSVDTADALISVAKDNAGNGELLGRALSTQDQATTITWSTPLAAGDQVYLTITKHNYHPYQYDKLIESEYLAPITYLLTVNQQGSGSGDITSTDGVIVCGDNCQTEYEADATVDLTAKADADSIFSGWSLDCSGSEPQTTLTMDADKSCQANFEKKTVQLTIVQPSGGEVTSDDGLLSCGSNCEASYTVGDSVSLTATPAANMVFSSWSGACSGTEATTTVTLTANKFCEATFELKSSLPEYHLLTVTKLGDGSGSVKSAPSGIYCNLTCEQTSADFPAQEIVTLTATVDEGSHFAGWGGACSGQQTEVSVTLDAAKDCSVEFVSQSAPPPNFHTLRVYKAGSGFGTVENKSRREEIKCGADCRENYEEGSRVALVATAAPFSTFIQWEGDCFDERRADYFITRMTMNTNMRCTAVFKSDFELAAEEMINLFYDNPENSVLINQYPRTAENEKRLKKAFWLAGVTLLQVEQHSASEWPHQLDDINKIATRSDPYYTQSVTVLSTEAIEIRVVLQTETGEGVEVALLITYDELLTSRTGLDTVKISIPSADNTLSTWIESCRDSTTSTLEAGICTERFERLIESGTYRLKVAKTGEGQGRIRFYTEQLNEKGRTRFYPQEFGCDYTCQETWYDYQANELVKLRAVASRDSVFTGWNGAACPREADDANIVMTMDQARTCVANFELSLAADTNTYSLNIDRAGSGHGVVNSRNARLGIACGEECNGIYEEGKKVALEAISSLFSTFEHWDEVCGGRVPTNSVTRVDMFTNFMCTATFTSDLDITAQELLATFYAQGILLEGILSEAYPQTAENETRLQEAFRLATLTLIEVDQHQESWPEQLNGINQIAALSQATTTQSVTVMTNQTVEIQLNLQTALGSEERVTVVIYYESTFDPSSSGYGAQTVFLDRAIFSQW